MCVSGMKGVDTKLWIPAGRFLGADLEESFLFNPISLQQLRCLSQAQVAKTGNEKSTASGSSPASGLHNQRLAAVDLATPKDLGVVGSYIFLFNRSDSKGSCHMVGSETKPT